MIDLDTGMLDGICRAMKASVEMLEGPACATFEFPFMLQKESGVEEVGIKVTAFRCSNPDCDGGVHVQIDVQPAITIYNWSQERSDRRLFGFDEDTGS